MTSLRKLSASFLGTASLCLLNLTPFSVNFSSSREFVSQKTVEINDFAELQRLDWYVGNDRWLQVSESIVIFIVSRGTALYRPKSQKGVLYSITFRVKLNFYPWNSNILLYPALFHYFVAAFSFVMASHKPVFHINSFHGCILYFDFTNFPVVGNWMRKKKPTRRGRS